MTGRLFGADPRGRGAAAGAAAGARVRDAGQVRHTNRLSPPFLQLGTKIARSIAEAGPHTCFLTVAPLPLCRSGKWHLGQGAFRYGPTARGFNEFFGQRNA